MTDETFTALQYAGPASWHHLIAPTHTFPLTDGTAQAAALSMDSACDHPNGISAVYALTDLAATANILSNAIANTIFTTVAIPIGELSFLRDVFMGAKLSKNQIAAIQRLSSCLPRTAADESE